MAMQQSEDSSLESNASVMKIVVVGEPRVGKTRFIRAFYDHNEPDDIYSNEGVRCYPCEFAFNNMRRKAEIVEIPGDPDFPREQTSYYREASAFVLIYAIDDPLSHERLAEEWLLRLQYFTASKRMPVVLVGNKIDLRHNPAVMGRLALKGETPVRYEDGRDFLCLERIDRFFEISTNSVQQVGSVFNFIFNNMLVRD